jgi:hypothetical protein
MGLPPVEAGIVKFTVARPLPGVTPVIVGGLGAEVEVFGVKISDSARTVVPSSPPATSTVL